MASQSTASVARLDAWLAAHRPKFLRRLNKGASDKQLERLGKHLGPLSSKLPPLLEELLRWRNGQNLEREDALYRSWALLSVNDLIEERLSLLENASRKGKAKHWVPFALSPDGILMIDLEGTLTGKKGEIVEWTWESDAQRPVHANLEAWLSTLVATFEADLWALPDGEAAVEPRDEDRLAQFVAKANPGYGIKTKAPRRKPAKNAKPTWLEGPRSWIGSLGPQKSGDGFADSKGPDADSKVLLRTLLALGGEKVVIPFDDQDVSGMFVANAEALEPKGVVMKKGRVSDCHANSARLWAEDRKARKLLTGYALSPDGLWRRHSWVLDKKGVLLESTEKRTLYFGITLPPPMARAFHRDYA